MAAAAAMAAIQAAANANVAGANAMAAPVASVAQLPPAAPVVVSAPQNGTLLNLDANVAVAAANAAGKVASQVPVSQKI